MADEHLTWARRYAVYALQERLQVGNPKNDMLRTRIAGIRAGSGDQLPEVRSVFLCLSENAIAMEARQGTDPEGLDGEAATARAGTASPKGQHQ